MDVAFVMVSINIIRVSVHVFSLSNAGVLVCMFISEDIAWWGMLAWYQFWEGQCVVYGVKLMQQENRWDSKMYGGCHEKLILQLSHLIMYLLHLHHVVIDIVEVKWFPDSSMIITGCITLILMKYDIYQWYYCWTDLSGSDNPNTFTRVEEGREGGEKNVRSTSAGAGARTRDFPHARRGSPAACHGSCLDKPAFPWL